MPTRDIYIRFKGCGNEAEILVDGHDVTHCVRGLRLDLEAGELGRCYLDLIASSVDVETEVGHIGASVRQLYDSRHPRHTAVHAVQCLRTGRRTEYLEA